MMLPIRITRFEVGESVAKKNAIPKNTGLRRRQQTTAAAAAPKHTSSEITAFMSSQPPPRPNRGFSLYE